MGEESIGLDDRMDRFGGSGQAREGIQLGVRVFCFMRALARWMGAEPVKAIVGWAGLWSVEPEDSVAHCRGAGNADDASWIRPQPADFDY